MTTKKEITTSTRWAVKLLLIVIGALTTAMPLIPLFKEYVLGGPEKQFGTKEILVMFVGTLLWTGAFYSNRMLDFAKEAIIKKAKNATK